MRQSLISVPNFFGSWIQSCTKLVGTHALLIIITFIIKMYVYKMTCMIQYPCSKHASSPSLPHQAMLVHICFLFIRSALSLTTLILGERGTEFLLQSVPTVSYTMVDTFRGWCSDHRVNRLVGAEQWCLNLSSVQNMSSIYFSSTKFLKEIWKFFWNCSDKLCHWSMWNTHNNSVQYWDIQKECHAPRIFLKMIHSTNGDNTRRLLTAPQIQRESQNRFSQWFS